MAISEFVDGTTPLDASHMNELVGGVNDLTAQVDELNSRTLFTFYTDCKQLGVSEPTSVNDIYEAMPNYSILIMLSDNYDFKACAQGIFVMIRISQSRTATFTFGKTSTYGDWRMFMANTGNTYEGQSWVKLT